MLSCKTRVSSLLLSQLPSLEDVARPSEDVTETKDVSEIACRSTFFLVRRWCTRGGQFAGITRFLASSPSCALRRPIFPILATWTTLSLLSSFSFQNMHSLRKCLSPIFGGRTYRQIRSSSLDRLLTLLSCFWPFSSGVDCAPSRPLLIDIRSLKRLEVFGCSNVKVLRRFGYFDTMFHEESEVFVKGGMSKFKFDFNPD